MAINPRRMSGLFLCLLAGLFWLAACAPAGTTKEPAAADGPEAASFADLDLVLPQPFDPPLELKSVISVDATVKFEEGDDIYNNVWTRAYAELLGIQMNYQWVVDASQYEQKLNATIMSGEIPDMFHANTGLLKLLHDSDLILDLSSVYAEYASENTKEIMLQDPLALKAASIEGKLMGVPMTDSAAASAQLLWLRQDWLDKLGLPGPQSMADVLEIARQFTENDPDGNGLDDTVGLALTKGLWGAIAGLQGFFNGYHAYPGIWLEKDGQLQYGSVQPQMREALAALQMMYSAGQIDKEFGVKDINKINEAIANSKIGMEYGVWWNPYQPLQLSQQNYPDAYWSAFALPSVDKQPAKSQYQTSAGSFIVAGKDCQHPEALLMLVNFWTDNIVKTDSQLIRDTFLGTIETPDIVYYKYIITQIWEPDAMLRGGKVLRQALAQRKPELLNLDEQWRYQIILAYLDQGIKEAWVEVATYGEGGAVYLLEDVVQDKGIINQFYGAPTPVMGDKMATLRTMEDEMITKIIMGDSLASFEKFVADWYQMGGTEITAEVNEWKSLNP